MQLRVLKAAQADSAERRLGIACMCSYTLEMSALRLVTRTVLVVLAVAAVVGGICLCIGISTSLHADEYPPCHTRYDEVTFSGLLQPNAAGQIQCLPRSEGETRRGIDWRSWLKSRVSRRRQTFMQIDLFTASLRKSHPRRPSIVTVPFSSSRACGFRRLHYRHP